MQEVRVDFTNTKWSSPSSQFPIFTCKEIETYGQSFWSYPVALEARAELRDSLALTSMMQYSIEVG